MSEQIIREIDALNVTMNGGSTVLNAVRALVMFGVAPGIKPRTFVDIVKNPKSIITGIACQLVLLPALTLLLIMAMGNLISPMFALGMILVASCPGGNISNFITSLSRGNSELSVSLTAFNTAICVFSTPLNFAFWGKMYLNFAGNHYIGELPELVIPLGDIFQSIFIIMGIPLVLGILCGQYLPKVANVLKKPLQYLSIIVFIAMVIIIFTGNLDVFMKVIKYIFLVVLLHNLLALGIGFSTSNHRDRYPELRSWSCTPSQSQHLPRLRRMGQQRRYARHHRMVGRMAYHLRPDSCRSLEMER